MQNLQSNTHTSTLSFGVSLSVHVCIHLCIHVGQWVPCFSTMSHSWNRVSHSALPRLSTSMSSSPPVSTLSSMLGVHARFSCRCWRFRLGSSCWWSKCYYPLNHLSSPLCSLGFSLCQTGRTSSVCAFDHWVDVPRVLMKKIQFQRFHDVNNNPRPLEGFARDQLLSQCF